MTLKEICEVGYACGLTTIQEAILNAELHWDIWTTPTDIDKDFNSIYNEFNEIDSDCDKKDLLIHEIFPDIKDVFSDFEQNLNYQSREEGRMNEFEM